MKRLPLHQALSSLSWLEGKWQIQKYGCGQYPTIEDFKYCEEISFTSIGQPMFNYLAQSWQMENKIPLHRETGFLKVIPCTNKLSFILAHNSGLTTIEEGEVIDQTIKLNSVSIQRAQRLELPVVTRVCLNLIVVISFISLLSYKV